MIKFIELNTIGVSKDSQLRAAKIIKAVCDGYELSSYGDASRLFHFARHKMAARWNRLRLAVEASGIFTLPDELPGHCSFSNDTVTSNPRKTSSIFICLPIELKFLNTYNIFLYVYH